jgi:hypothetical protein
MKMYFVIAMDLDTVDFGHVKPGKIMDAVDFAKLVTDCAPVESVAFTSWDLAADYSEAVHPEFLTE